MSDGEISELSSDEEYRFAKHLQHEADARAFLARLEAREAAEEAGSSAAVAPSGRRKVRVKRGVGRRTHRARSLLASTSGKFRWDIKSSADRGHPKGVRVHPVVRKGRPSKVPVVVSSETDEFSDVSSTDWDPATVPALPVAVRVPVAAPVPVAVPVPLAVPVTVHRATIVQGGRPLAQNDPGYWGTHSTDSGSVDTMSSCVTDEEEPEEPDLDETLTPAQPDDTVDMSSADEVFLSPAPKQRIAEGKKLDIFDLGNLAKVAQTYTCIGNNNRTKFLGICRIAIDPRYRMRPSATFSDHHSMGRIGRRHLGGTQKC
jgi:hypothetical protein